MLSGRVQHGRSARLWSSDECASITAARPPIAAPASTSTPTALPCAILCHAAGFWAVLRSGIAARKSPNDALLNFSFFKRHPSGHLRTSEPPNNAFLSRRPRIYVQARPASAAASADGRACSFNPTVPLSSTPGSPAPQPGTFVDVGANGGWETRLALAAGMNVLAVECLPEAYQELRVIFHGMPAARLRLLHACASNSTGVATLHRAADSSSMVLNNVRSGPEALKAGKERTKESQVHSVVLDSELLPTGTPDSASLRVDVRLVKIDTQVAPRHRTLLQENQIPHCRLPPPPYVSSIALLPIPCGRGTSCSCYPGCVALSARGDLSSFTRTTKWRLLHLQRLKRCCRPRH
jgi:FkbM family methyltransferase